MHREQVSKFKNAADNKIVKQQGSDNKGMNKWETAVMVHLGPEHPYP